MARRKTKERTAAESDPHDLYELSVQDPGRDCDFVEQAWKEVRGRAPRALREDFCGSAITAIEWVKRSPRHTAIGVDLDPAVLGVASRRITKRLKPEQRGRLRLLEESVLRVETDPVDCVLAMNFSYWLFKDRRTMKRYFRRVRDALVDDGLMILDAYGGSDTFLEMKEPREIDGFTYVWDRQHYNPVSGDLIQHIHFRFPDGSKLESAFVYEWRLWTLPELIELLREAGFDDVTCYWEGSDEDGDGNGEWAPTKVGEACAGWVAYLVAAK